MIISPDEYRKESGTYVYDPETELDIKLKAYKAFHEALKSYHRAIVLVGPPGSGKSTWVAKQVFERYEAVIFDATSTAVMERRGLIAFAHVLAKPIEAVVFKTSLQTCLERNAMRPPGRRVPEQVICRMYLNLANQRPSTKEGFYNVIEAD